MRLRELEAEKERIEWEHLQSEPIRNAQPHIFPKHTHLSVEVCIIYSFLRYYLNIA